jgi:hypothetical protein
MPRLTAIAHSELTSIERGRHAPRRRLDVNASAEIDGRVREPVRTEVDAAGADAVAIVRPRPVQLFRRDHRDRRCEDVCVDHAQRKQNPTDWRSKTSAAGWPVRYCLRESLVEFARGDQFRRGSYVESSGGLGNHQKRRLRRGRQVHN